MDTKHILVIGATKGIGLAVTDEALERGHRVRAFARSAKEMARDHPRLEKRSGDATDEGDVAAAVDGIDAVVMALGVKEGVGMVVRETTLFSRATEVLIPAMQAAGVDRVIAVTGIGTSESRSALSAVERLPWRAVLGRVYDDKTRQETLLRGSGLTWTFVRPTILTNGPRTGDYRVLADAASWRNGLISRKNVAHFVVGEVETGTYAGQGPVLAR